MPIAKSHGNPDKVQRVPKSSSDGKGGFMAKTKVYKQVDEINGNWVIIFLFCVKIARSIDLGGIQVEYSD